MDKWIQFTCGHCKKDYMYLKGAKFGGNGYAFEYEYCSDPRYPSLYTYTKYICTDCDKKHNLSGNYTKDKKEELPEGEGIAVSVADYNLLKFARRNPICKMLYKVIGNR